MAVHWFNVNAFTQAANGTVGDLRRNTVLGPDHKNFDASLAKVFPFREGMSFQLRLEAYNATNTTNFLAASGVYQPLRLFSGELQFWGSDRGSWRTDSTAGRQVRLLRANPDAESYRRSDCARLPYPWEPSLCLPLDLSKKHSCNLPGLPLWWMGDSSSNIEGSG